MDSQITLTHNEGAGPIETIMFSCSGEEIETWARTYVLEDYGISTTQETIIHTGEIAFSTSYGGATAKFRIYVIDNNFPDSFPDAILLGSSQIEVIPFVSTPQIMTVYFNNPVVVPPNTQRILVEVEKGNNPDSFSSPVAYAAGSEYENDYSWYKGCGQNFNYKITSELAPPRPHANFIVNLIVNTNLAVDDITNNSFSLYPNPTQNILKINSKFPLGGYKIYSINGVLEIEGFTNQTIDVSRLSSGIYFVKIKMDERIVIKKFIKE